MKFKEILRFELRYQLRHITTWLLFAVLFLFGFIVLRLVTPSDDTNLNSPSTIYFFTIFAGMIWLVIGGVVAGEAATRDIQTLMHPLTFTTPVSKFSYLAARFTAALTLNASIFLGLFLALLLSYYTPGIRLNLVGPFRLASYLTSYFFIALPAVVAVTSIQFAFAALSGRAIAGYIASVVIILFSQFGGVTVRLLVEWKVLGTIMDLMGISIVSELGAWTPLEKNTRLILLEGTWLWNRVAWLGVAVLALVFTYYRFRIGHLAPKKAIWEFLRRRKLSAPGMQAYDAGPIIVTTIQRNFELTTYLRQVIAIASASIRTIARSLGGLTFVALVAMGTGLFATEYMEFLGVPLLARTHEVLRLVAPPLHSITTQWVVIPLLIIFYAGELIWHEREAGMSDLSDTAPVPEWTIFLGKFLGLAIIIAAWTSLMMAAGILNQLVMDYHDHKIWVYVKALFGLQLTNYLLFAALVVSIHVVVNQKYVAYIVAAFAYAFMLFPTAVGVEHKLLIYASDSGWKYSDFYGFGSFAKPWLWFKFYWASWALLIGCLAIAFWVRNKETGLRRRLQLAKHNIAKYKQAIILAVGLIVVSGGFIFYNVNILHKYMTVEDRLKMWADYERLYSKYDGIVQPSLVSTKIRVEIYPEDGSADIEGTYHLVNRGKKNIDSIHISTVPQNGITDVSFFFLPSEPAVIDEAVGYQIYSLKDPLSPGDSLTMSFTLKIKHNGFGNNEAAVVENGTYIKSDDWMPVLGYDDDRRLHDKHAREKYGLPPRATRPSLYDTAARYRVLHTGQGDFEAIVGTSKDQTAVAPGTLKRSWNEGDRQYFHYLTSAPVNHHYAIFSARYAVRETKWDDVTIQSFFHPNHDSIVDRVLKSAQASFEYYTKVFGPYPHKVFRVLERPGHGRGAHADPMTATYQEGYSLMNPAPGGLDLPYHIMAHEVAHQWWGHTFAPAAVEGSGLLVESPATYSAMQVVEKNLGYEHLLRYLAQMRIEYVMPHSPAAPPLLQSNNSFMNYRKGPFALYALRSYIGKDSVNSALRKLIDNYSADPPLPTTLDLYKNLQDVTPDSLQYLVYDLFAANTFWELEAKSASAKRIDVDTWQVILEVDARKKTVDSIGVETQVPMNEWLEIGVYAPRKEGEFRPKPLYVQRHLITTGRQTFFLNVSELPGRAGIDPNRLMIDVEIANNTIDVKVTD